MSIKTLGLSALLLLALAVSCNKGASTKDSGISVGQAPATRAIAASTGDKAVEAGKAACADKDCEDCPAKVAGGTEAGAGCPAKGAEAAGGHTAACLAGTDPAACANCPGCKGEAALIAKTGDGIRIVEATTVDIDPNPYCGRIALRGKVGDVFAEKGTFTLVDLKKMPGCTDGCCPKTNIPINVPQTAFSGTFPEAGDEVLVICNLSTTQGGGYQVAVEEVRAGEKTLLKQAKEA